MGYSMDTTHVVGNVWSGAFTRIYYVGGRKRSNMYPHPREGVGTPLIPNNFSLKPSKRLPAKPARGLDYLCNSRDRFKTYVDQGTDRFESEEVLNEGQEAGYHQQQPPKVCIARRCSIAISISININISRRRRVL